MLGSTEVWKTYPEVPTYEVSDQGRVRSTTCVGGIRKQPRIKKLTPDKDGYLVCSLCVGAGGKTVRRRVNRMVLLTFIGSPESGTHAAHVDNDRTNNRLVNLSWKTPTENEADKKVHGTVAQGEKQGHAKLTADDVLFIRSSSETYAVLADKFGVTVGAIGHVRSNRNWKHITGGPT